MTAWGVRAPFPSTTLRVNFKLRMTLRQAQSERMILLPPLIWFDKLTMSGNIPPCSTTRMDSRVWHGNDGLVCWKLV